MCTKGEHQSVYGLTGRLRLRSLFLVYAGYLLLILTVIFLAACSKKEYRLEGDITTPSIKIEKITQP